MSVGQNGYFNLADRQTPGIFIAGIESGIGKTVITCAMADVLHRYGGKVGVCKPFATGCRKERGSLISPDAEALAHFAHLDPAIGGLPLVSPVTYKPTTDPAITLGLSGETFDPSLIARSLSTLDSSCDIILVEGIGGLASPLDPARSDLTQIGFIRELGFPVVLATRATEGALSHTALAVAALRAAGCRVAGLVVNYYEPDTPDAAIQMTRDFLTRMNHLPVLSTVPNVSSGEGVGLEAGVLHDEVRAAVALTDWRKVASRPKPVAQFQYTQNDTQGRYVTYVKPKE